MNRDPAELGEVERRSPGVCMLFVSLDAAIDAFAKDTLGNGWFTPTMVEAYTALEPCDAGAFVESTSNRRCEQYAPAY